MRKEAGMRSRHMLAASVLALSATVPFSALACMDSSSVYVGTVCTVAYDWCPSGYVQANGQLLQITAYQALYSLVGTKYGGDGKVNFGIPDLRGRAMVGTGTPVDANSNPVGVNVPLAGKVGQQALILQTSQVPLVPHTHSAQFAPVVSPVSVQIPATQGNLTVSASLPVSTAVGTVAGPMADLTAGQTGYLAGLSGLAGASTVKFTGPYTTTAPGSGTAASLPANVQVSGTAGTAAATVNMNQVTGGSVSIGAAGQPAAASVSTQSPGLGLTACIAVIGLYPPRP